MTELQLILHRELYRKSFYDFVKAFWSTADPAKLVDGALIKCYCEIFQYMCKPWIGYNNIAIAVPPPVDNEIIIDVRQGKKNLCLMVPPRHTKSMIFNVFGPVWLWLSAPVLAVSISHTGGLAGKMNSKRHAIINSEKFKLFFPEIVLTANSAGFLKDSRGGELYSLNKNAFTGYGGDIIINDDLTNAESAKKDKAEMANSWSYYQTTMPSRINNIDKSIIMNIQQRLAPNDIAGHIMADAKLASTYVFVTLPAIFEKTTHVVCPISGDVVTFKAGDCLWPERFGNYDDLRYQVGETIFQTQYLQNPIASDKTVVKQEMIIEKDINEVPGIEYASIVYAAHDFPVKDKDSSDYLGSVLAYRVNSTLYIVDCLETKMAFVKSVQYVEHLDSSYAGIIQIIEDKANGSPILQQLQDAVPGMQAFEPGTGSKMQRLESASLYMNSKNVVFVKSEKIDDGQFELSDSLKNLVLRLLNFPFVEHDDIVDAFSMLLLFVFMDKRFAVYGRSFTEDNVVQSFDVTAPNTSSTVFFNKDGDIWKVSEIYIEYGVETKIIVNRECRFKADAKTGLAKLKSFAPNKRVFIDCSASDSMRGIHDENVVIERYEIEDFDKSVMKTNLAFSKNQILILSNCVLTKSELANFKFSKSKDEHAKYVTDRDGFIACIRMALHYHGNIF